MLLADLVYNVPANVILDSARRALTGYDVVVSIIKAWAFSTAISVVGRPPGRSLRAACCCAASDRPRFCCGGPHPSSTPFPTPTPPHRGPQISCAWGFTTSGGAKGVGESTTSAVVISLVTIFVLDFVLSYVFFQGQGDALKQLKG